ncbi:MAG: hypothetical protein ACI9IA_002162 [Enterobacterales bacterium]|jgi:hypothetical protein
MSKPMKKYFIFVTLFITSTITLGCDFKEVTFDRDFSAAHLDECKQLSSDNYLLTIRPENTPINDSPWYAFKVSSTDTSQDPSQEKKTINISIKFIDGNRRYLPKMSVDGKNWQSIPYKNNPQNENQMSFKVEVSAKPILIAGQEIINNEHYFTWAENIDKNTELSLSILGESSQGRPILQLTHKTESKEWLVLTGRMHPPEITGALAMLPFVGELVLNKDIGKQFRERFNILVVPNLNPDGVEHGYWRHNINGVDLNRDWIKLKQKETQLVHNKLQQIVKEGGNIVFAIDFHSTKRNVFYSMPTDYGAMPALFVENWLGNLDKQAPDFKVTIKPGNNPGQGVFKQYIADNYGVHAITYEMGDNESRNVINSIARVAAKTLMEELMATNKNQFVNQK